MKNKVEKRKMEKCCVCDLRLKERNEEVGTKIVQENDRREKRRWTV